MSERFIYYHQLKSSGKSKWKKLPIPQGFQINKFGSRFVTRLDRSKVSRWSDDSRILRSVVFDREHEIISVGLPKFFDHTKDISYLQQAEERGFSAWVKYDGSLLIRYVDRGKVVFRTRNTLTVSELVHEATQFAEQNYPYLLDPSWGEDYSLHFEYLNPRRELVVPIKAEELVLIGSAVNKQLKLLTPAETIHALPELTNIPAAEQLVENCASVEDLLDVVGEREIEGAVLRFERGQKMLRVKTDYYRARSHEKQNKSELVNS